MRFRAAPDVRRAPVRATLVGMATDMTDPLPPQAPPRRLRRRREGRVAAGVAGGLGDYFAVDPVLFRVLFATSAFFGGAGILAYLLAWAVVPDEGTEDAAIDRWISELRRRRIPLWIVVAVAGVVLWALAFSWWVPGPGPAVPIVAIVIALLYARRGSHREPPAGSPAPPAPTPPGSPEGSPTGSPVNLTKSTPAPAAGGRHLTRRGWASCGTGTPSRGPPPAAGVAGRCRCA